ncbi:MAG: tetratricopeptide repeat protein [bacterium]|nr:tetratricopeptide repeat protein [bacterium]
MRKITNIEKILFTQTSEEEEKILKEIIQVDPTNVIACIRLGNLLRERGDYTDALKLHKSLLVEPVAEFKKEIYVSMIKDCIRAKKDKLAVPFVKELQKIASKDCSVLEFLYKFYEEFSYWDEAIELKKRILALKGKTDNGSLAILYAIWGNSLIEAGDTERGIKHFKEALVLDKLCLPALLLLGDFYYESGEEEKGIELWQQVVENLPAYAFVAFERLEKAYYVGHNYSNLLSSYTSFLKHHPDNVHVLVRLAEIYEKMGEDEEAIDLLERAGEVSPSNLLIMKTLFKFYYNNNRYEDMFKKGTELFSLSSPQYKDFKCCKCGMQFTKFDFRCSNCKNWLTIK